MNHLSRRLLLQAAGSAMLPAGLAAASGGQVAGLKIAPFRIDVTPPNGHGCCGGWIKPIEDVDDAQEAAGFVLLGAGDPIVVCAVDWTGILNTAHLRWRSAMADAAGTTPDRAAVQCVHQHNAPFACLDTQKLITEQGDLPNTMIPEFFEQCLERLSDAIRDAVLRAVPLTHIAHGSGEVLQVASNRRINLSPDGRIVSMRGSSCRDENLRAMTEGLIDPQLRTVAFCNGDQKIVCCHYYAVHPMSYYGDGRASSDFTGLARRKRQQETPDCLQIYFTGAAGNIAAGKYNNGSREMRAILADRVYEGILRADASLQHAEIDAVSWSTADLLPEARMSPSDEELAAAISNRSLRVVGRNRPAFELAWKRRVESGLPITLSRLKINDVNMLHLPAESFIEYQLRAASMADNQFVAVAAYGDGGPWYIPVREAWSQGGYEVSVAFCAEAVDDELTAGIRKLMTSG